MLITRLVGEISRNYIHCDTVGFYPGHVLMLVQDPWAGHTEWMLRQQCDTIQLNPQRSPFSVPVLSLLKGD